MIQSSRLFIGVASMIFLFPLAASAAFKDVSSTRRDAEAIAYIQSHGIVSGYNDGTFRPDSAINRAEFLKIVLAANFRSDDIQSCDLSSVKYDPRELIDITANQWYSQYVCYGRLHAIISGYPDGTFRPDKKINFPEASKIIASVYLFSVERGSQLPVVQDENIWYEPFVRYLSERNAIPTTIPTIDHNLTRGEMAEIIYRLSTKMTNKPSWTYESLSTTTPRPSVGISWLVYYSPEDNYRIEHLADWHAEEHLTGPGQFKDSVAISGTTFLPNTQQKGMFDNVWMMIGKADTCPPMLIGNDPVMIGGKLFSKNSWDSNVMAGERVHGTTYTTTTAGQCLIITTAWHYHEPSFALDTSNTADERQLALDKATFSDVFARMLASITFESYVLSPIKLQASVYDSIFEPKNIKIKRGTTITWTNRGTTSHTITGDYGGPDSPVMKPGEKYSYTFGKSGTFGYHCSIHPNLTAAITVSE